MRPIIYMDIELVKDTIAELEKSDTNFSNCKDLASLYIVLDHFSVPIKSNLYNIEDELNDIMPAYKEYCNSKREYQLGNTTDDVMIDKLDILCNEIFQFLHTLYTNTDTKLERIKLKNTINKFTDIMR